MNRSAHIQVSGWTEGRTEGRTDGDRYKQTDLGPQQLAELTNQGERRGIESCRVLGCITHAG